MFKRKSKKTTNTVEFEDVEFEDVEFEDDLDDIENDISNEDNYSYKNDNRILPPDEDEIFENEKKGFLGKIFNSLFKPSVSKKVMPVDINEQDSNFINVIQNYLILSSEDSEKEHKSTLIEYNYKELLNNPSIYEDFISEVNKRFHLKYYKTLEELKKDYDLFDYDNIQQIYNDYTAFQHTEGGMGSKASGMYGENANIETISKKIDSARNNFIIPMTNKKTHKKTVGVAYPNMKIMNFYLQEDVVFIGIDIVNQIWGIKNVDFLKEGDEDEMSENLLKLLTYMDTGGISDLHLYKETETHYTLTARVGDTVLKVIDAPIKIKLAESLIRAILISGKVDTMSRQVEVKALIKRRLKNNMVRNFRVSVVDTSVGNSLGKSVSIRKLAGSDSLKSLESLNYSTQAVSIIKDIVHNFKKGDGGIIVISGATNSGKTTLLYAILTMMLKKFKSEYQEANNEQRTSEKKMSRIFTIENPVEITVPDLIQLDLSKTEQAEDKNRLTIEKAKNIILRQDPDVALVGEVRAKEEVQTVFELANTGHLAYTTIHANDAKSTLQRIQNTGNIGDDTLRLLMQMIINQELVDKLCNHCGGTGYLNSRIEGGDKDRCPMCHKTGKEVNPGVNGRLPLYELVYFDKSKITLEDDLYDFENLAKEGKILHITKGDIAEVYYKEGILAKSIYEKYTGKTSANIIKGK